MLSCPVTVSEEDTAAYMVQELSKRKAVYQWINQNFPLGEDDEKARLLIREVDVSSI